MNWKALTKTAKRTLSRNSSKILLGLGIAGAFTAVGFAITATPKAMILLEEKKQKLEEENKLLQAKTEAINATKDNEELYREVLKAMREYSGEDDGEGSEVFME